MSFDHHLRNHAGQHARQQDKRHGKHEEHSTQTRLFTAFQPVHHRIQQAGDNRPHRQRPEHRIQHVEQFA